MSQSHHIDPMLPLRRPRPRTTGATPDEAASLLAATALAVETLDEMSVGGRVLLLYLETRAVDHGGLVDAAHMNREDFETAKEWTAGGFIRFARIPSRLWGDVRSPARHVVELGGMAWGVAGAERQRRARRSQRVEIVGPALERGAGDGD